MSMRSLANLVVDPVKRRVLFIGISLLTSIIFLPTPSTAVIRSRSAIVVEASTGRILYAKDPQCRLPPASTTKLMTAILTLDRLDLSGFFVVGRNAARAHRPRVFKQGDKVSIEQLLYAALIKSGNDAAVALAEAVSGSEEEFVHLMNREAALIGAENTVFVNSSGLPGPGQYTTVSDLTTIMRHALGYPKLREILGTPVVQLSTAKGRNVLLKNTDKLLWSDKTLIGGKTGFTFDAGHCFVGAAERQERRIVVALLNSPSRRLLWKETEELIRKGFNVPVDMGQESTKF